MTIEKTNAINIGVILLAAGNSSRLGRPKQLLDYEGRTLLQHSIQVAVESNANPVVVVVGAKAETIKHEIQGKEIKVVENEEWEEGMASSIRCGIQAFSQLTPGAEGTILMVCDQPFVTASLLNELITAHQKTGKPIVACGYENTFGPPVFFHHSVFQELLSLQGDIGARAILSQHSDDVEIIPFPKGNFDVDTEADYERIKSNSKQQ